MGRKMAAGRHVTNKKKNTKKQGCTGPHRAVTTAAEAEHDGCAYVVSPKGERAPFKTIKNRK